MTIEALADRVEILEQLMAALVGAAEAEKPTLTAAMAEMHEAHKARAKQIRAQKGIQP